MSSVGLQSKLFLKPSPLSVVSSQSSNKVSLQSHYQTVYNVHSILAFFLLTVNKLDKSVDSLISAFLTPSQAPAAARQKQRVRSVENDVIKLTLKSGERTLV